MDISVVIPLFNEEESLKELFKGNKIQTRKGYIHETFNPRTDIKIGTHFEKDELHRFHLILN